MPFIQLGGYPGAGGGGAGIDPGGAPYFLERSNTPLALPAGGFTEVEWDNVFGSANGNYSDWQGQPAPFTQFGLPVGAYEATYEVEIAGPPTSRTMSAELWVGEDGNYVHSVGTSQVSAPAELTAGSVVRGNGLLLVPGAGNLISLQVRCFPTDSSEANGEVADAQITYSYLLLRPLTAG